MFLLANWIQDLVLYSRKKIYRVHSSGMDMNVFQDKEFELKPNHKEAGETSIDVSMPVKAAS